MATKKGYLAVLWKAKDVQISSQTTYQLMRDSDLELSNWPVILASKADDKEALKLHDADGGFTKDLLGAVVHNTSDATYATVAAVVDSGELTLDADIMDTNESYEIYFWTPIVASAGAGDTVTVEALKGWNERSYGAKVVNKALGECGLYQVRTFDTSLTASVSGVASVWAKLPTTNTGTLYVEFQDSNGTALASAQDTIEANNKWYGDAKWGYWSLFTEAPATTQRVMVKVTTSIGAGSQTSYFDNLEFRFLEKLNGAHGNLAVSERVEMRETTEFGDGAYPKHTPTMHTKEIGPIETWWNGSDTYPEVAEDVETFLVAFTRKGNSYERWECPCRISSVEHGIERDGIQTRTVTLVPSGIPGFTEV